MTDEAVADDNVESAVGRRLRLCAKPPLEAADYRLRNHKKADFLPP